MMKVIIQSLLIIAALIPMSCKEKYENKNLIDVPAFEIKIDLDERAASELQARRETIKISLWLSGIPRKDAGIKEIDKVFGLVLGFFEKKIDKEGVVRFEGLKISENLYQAIEDKDYWVSISVVSGRKAVSYNLLNCEPFAKGISSVAGKQYTIKCTLIRDSK